MTTVRVTGPAYFDVHPDALKQHKELGWRECAKQEAPEADGKPSDGLTANELKAALTEKGISFKTNASKTDLQTLLDAQCRRSTPAAVVVHLTAQEPT